MSPRIWPLVIAAAIVAHAGSPAYAQTPAPTKPEAAQSATPSAAAPKPEASAPAPAAKPAAVAAKRFASPEEATQALVAALRSGDTKELVTVLGSEGRGLVISGDAVVDKQSREKFLKSYDAANRLIPYGDHTVLQVGDDNWPFPIPLIPDGKRWWFDARRGREELIARRIGRNELYTIETCLAYVDAQREYYEVDHAGDGILEYAQKFGSTPGKRDGLFWETKPGEPLSPLGDLVARARAEGYKRAKSGPTPYHGYLYRILTSQGPAASDGAYDYVVRGHMMGGFALVAFPAQYGVSGIMTFIVNQDGVVHQKDLGSNTHALGMAMKKYNPDSTWTKVEPVTDITPPQD